MIICRTPYRLSFFGGGADFPAWFRKGNPIQEALDTLNASRAALHFEKGGEIARNLDGLHSFWTQHVIKADRNKDTRSLDQVASMLEEIKSALEGVYVGHSENQTPPLRVGDPPLSCTQKAVPVIPKGPSR